MSPRSRTACALLTIAAFLLAGCSTPEHPATQARVVPLSGTVVAQPEESATANIIVVAPSQDPIWDGIRELTAINDGDGPDITYRGEEVVLVPGTDLDGVRAGTLVVTMPAELDEFDLRDIKLTLNKGDHPTSALHAGNWHFQRRDSTGALSVVEEYPVSVPECGQIEFTLQNSGSYPYAIERVESNDPTVNVTHFESAPMTGGTQVVQLVLQCDDDYILHTFTPSITFKKDNKQFEEILEPILIGYMDLSSEDIRRVMSK